MYTGTIGSRPAELSGNLQTWREKDDESATLRSKMDDGQTIKVRRRVTVAIRNGEASVTIVAADVPFWRQWYKQNCQNGVLPTLLRFPPECDEDLWRFSTPIQYEWIDKTACRLSFSLEKLPQYVWP
jgi:hypothetical protein